MVVLGISCYYHDSAAAVIVDGNLVAAAEQERFSRKKHDSDFPHDAIDFCLQKAGITIDQVDAIAFYEKPLLKFERLLFSHIEGFPFGLPTFLKAMPSWLGSKLRIQSTIKKKLSYRGPVYYVHHHMAHAAAAFLVSPFERAAICTSDGVGEWTTNALGSAQGSTITLSKDVRFPHSLGLLYSTVTAYLGFSVNNSEYKVMGLSPNGDPEPYAEHFRQIIKVADDGSYAFDMSYFDFHKRSRMPSKKFCDLFGGPPRKAESALEQRHKDIAAALQKRVEEISLAQLRHLHAVTGQTNLVMGGGVALNSVFNGKIISQTPFEHVWIHPNATDGGSSVGAAYYVYNTVLGNPRSEAFSHPYLGPSYSDELVEDFLEENGIVYERFENDGQLIAVAADLLHKDNVIGWFQGGLEWGPRALGARSILSNACNPDMKDILNTKVKHREPFRPFAPVVCAEDAPTYFQCDIPVPQPADYMLMVYPIKPEYHKRIPAVTHVDGSGRLQTIRREQNARYYDVIKAFGKRSGIPILVNTSFNIRGEPIVNSPYDAYRCMMGTGIDCLIIGSYIVYREKNPQHMWDSEVLAVD